MNSSDRGNKLPCVLRTRKANHNFSCGIALSRKAESVTDKNSVGFCAVEHIQAGNALRLPSNSRGFIILHCRSPQRRKDAVKIAPLGRVAISSIFTEARLAVEPNGLQFAIGTNGAIIASSHITSSDARLKQNIAAVPDALSTILNLRGVTYDWNPNVPNAIKEVKGRQYGFLAQEVETVLPDLVQPGLNGYKAVNYQGIIPVLVEAVKAQQKQIDTLKAGLKSADALAARMDAMEVENRQLKRLLQEMAHWVEPLGTNAAR